VLVVAAGFGFALEQTSRHRARPLIDLLNAVTGSSSVLLVLMSALKDLRSPGSDKQG
jgi:hypothetical protein